MSNYHNILLQIYMERQKVIGFAISFFQSTLSEMKSQTDVTRQLFAIYKLELGNGEKLCFENMGKIVEKYNFNKLFNYRPNTLRFSKILL